MTNENVVEASLRNDTVHMTEKAAFDFYKEAQEQAFNLDGMLGVIQLGMFATQEADAVAGACEADGQDESMARAVVSAHLLTTWIPQIIEGMAEHSKKEGNDAVKAVTKATKKKTK